MIIPKDEYTVEKCRKCGRTSFDFLKVENNVKIICDTCGRTLRAADVDEMNLYRLKKSKEK